MVSDKKLLTGVKLEIFFSMENKPKVYSNILILELKTEGEVWDSSKNLPR